MADSLENTAASIIERILLWGRFIPPAAGVATIGLGLSVLVGWEFGIEGLKRVAPQYVAMNPATAIGLLMSGICLVLSGAITEAASRVDDLIRGHAQVEAIQAEVAELIQHAAECGRIFRCDGDDTQQIDRTDRNAGAI